MKGRFQSACLALFIVAGLLFGGVPAVFAADLAKDGIRWFSYDQGLARAKAQQKKVFLHFYTNWCRYCDMMAASTFVDKKVIDTLNQDFVSIRVNSDEVRDVAGKYQVRGVPVSFFLEADGGQIGSRPGFLEPDVFLRLLEFVKAEGYK
ncbi:MAG: DUF255 domain-containing protein [Thermodesulfobacteriota bacterium]|nr:DUF255 domain-containing protein [Thermodesulfobacteriota bacterium]